MVYISGLGGCLHLHSLVFYLIFAPVSQDFVAYTSEEIDWPPNNFSPHLSMGAGQRMLGLIGLSLVPNNFSPHLSMDAWHANPPNKKPCHGWVEPLSSEGWQFSVSQISHYFSLFGLSSRDTTYNMLRALGNKFFSF